MAKSRKIIIVEDDLISAEYLKEILIRDGNSILKIIDNGKEAVVQCLKLKPDIVLMDIMLKDDMRGCEAAQKIKENLCDCKIIFLTAYTSQSVMDCAVKSQAYAYLLKPLREEELLTTIKLAC